MFIVAAAAISIQFMFETLFSNSVISSLLCELGNNSIGSGWDLFILLFIAAIVIFLIWSLFFFRAEKKQSKDTDKQADIKHFNYKIFLQIGSASILTFLVVLFLLVFDYEAATLIMLIADFCVTIPEFFFSNEKKKELEIIKKDKEIREQMKELIREMDNKKLAHRDFIQETKKLFH